MSQPNTRVVTNLTAAEWDDFVAKTNGDVLSQSTLWAQVKAPGYEAHRVALAMDDEICAGCQLLSRRLGPLRVAYGANGPLLAPGHTHMADAIVEQVCHLARSLRVAALILQPASRLPEMSEALARRGFSAAPVSVSTPASVVVDLTTDPEDLLATMRSSRRRNIRKAQRAGLALRRGTRDDLDTFHRLHAVTAARQGFAPMTMAYLERQWDVLGAAGALDVFLAELDGVALSAATVTRFGDRSVYKLAGMSDAKEATKVRASEFMHWEIMLDAKSRGSRFYDFGGFDREMAELLERGEELPESFRSSASQFKLGFGGQTVLLPSSVWRLSPQPLRPFQRPLSWGYHKVRVLDRVVARLRSA